MTHVDRARRSRTPDRAKGQLSVVQSQGINAWRTFGGGLDSTMDDYLRFSMMLLNGGVAGGERVLSKEAVELVVTNHLSGTVKHPDPKFMHGLGGIIEPDTGEYGWSGATSPYFRIDPQNKLLILSMTQSRANSHKTYGVDFRNLIRDGLE
ncbi:serine hydrolase [Opitutaceae bacterium]|nr:serine hydrolase [Opitutaceae bacterium]